jgi:hypothetical protein
MVRIRTREGFWGLVAWVVLAGCAVVGGAIEPRPSEPVSQWERYVLAGCLVALLLILPIRDLIAAWKETEKR